MGAPLAFSSRQQELLEIHERPPTDNEVVSSFLNSLAPKGGPLIEYLKNAQIGLVLGDTLFVHGAVHDYNLGYSTLSAITVLGTPYRNLYRLDGSQGT